MTRSSNSRPTTGGRSCCRRSALLALTVWMLVERPKAFIPTEDQGYLIASIQTPDGTGKEATARIAKTVGKIAQDLEAVSVGARARRLQRLERDQPDQLGHGVRHPRGMVQAQQARAAGERAQPQAPGANLGRGPRRRRFWCSSRRRSAA